MHELYQEAYTPWEWHEQLFKVANDEGLICFSSPFDNTAVGMLNIFIIITLEVWSDIMYMIRTVTDSYSYDIFFVIVVLLGNFFVLNLMIAV